VLQQLKGPITGWLSSIIIDLKGLFPRYRTIDDLQTDLDVWVTDYNERRSHQGRWRYGKTPMHAFLDALPLAKKNSW
jgi:hypothetical protein